MLFRKTVKEYKRQMASYKYHYGKNTTKHWSMIPT